MMSSCDVNGILKHQLFNIVRSKEYSIDRVIFKEYFHGQICAENMYHILVPDCQVARTVTTVFKKILLE